MSSNKHNIAVIGLGYVGLPLALALAPHYSVIGLDVDLRRVEELRSGLDRNNETDPAFLRSAPCRYTHIYEDVKHCSVFIVTVPTPIDEDNKPDLGYLQQASESLGPLLKKGDIVVYESTVYPGITEDFCGQILEKESGLTSGQDFYLGYSPERINPGDTKHTVQTITKVVAGQNPEIAQILLDIYGKTNGGNIYVAPDIKTAEASKVIENAQRDINVAFINEVTKIVNDMNLSVYDVLEAAGTKWNFLPFTPGLVGGHCIGVDPYYLAQCAQDLGHNPEVILAGRHTNDAMGEFFASSLIKKMGSGDKSVLIMGFTFKENINDIRNTKVIDVVRALEEKGVHVDVHDPHADVELVRHVYGIDLLPRLPREAEYDAAILAVPHQAYKPLGEEAIKNLFKGDGLLYDLKGFWREDALSQQNFYHTV